MERSACGGRSSGGWGRGDALAAGTPRHVYISKTLARILRHRAVALDINIRSDGYCALDDVLATRELQGLQVTRADVLSVVMNSSKKRFNVMDEDGTRLKQETFAAAFSGGPRLT